MRPRSKAPILLFALAFISCIAFAYLWFNTDLGRSGLLVTPKPGEGGSTHNSQPRLWLQARTNIEGYTFIPEPVSDAVMKTLGTTNIVSGTFVRSDSRATSDGRRAPDHTSRELAVWCLLIDGEALSGTTVSQSTLNASHSFHKVRQNMAAQFWDATKNRLAVRGPKQFARYSIPFNGDLAATLGRIKALVPIRSQPAPRTDAFL